MGLNVSSGNMYDFVTHTWNAIKGKCYHDCSYCYMKRWGGLNPVGFDEKELKTDLGKWNFIFVGSSCDMFSNNIPDEWVNKVLCKCSKHESNKYLFQTKNPSRILEFDNLILKKSTICTTIESDVFYKGIMVNSPEIQKRSDAMEIISQHVNTYVTVEPILKFKLFNFVDILKKCNPAQVNIGADSGKNNLPEPSKAEIYCLIKELEKFTKVKLKPNLNRLLK